MGKLKGLNGKSYLLPAAAGIYEIMGSGAKTRNEWGHTLALDSTMQHIFQQLFSTVELYFLHTGQTRFTTACLPFQNASQDS